MGFDEGTGEGYEWDAFRWGPDDSLDADDLEREVEERLGGYVEGKVEVARDLVSTFLAMTAEGGKLSQSCSSHWFEDLLDAGAYDGRGETREELAIAHEFPILRLPRPGRE